MYRLTTQQYPKVFLWNLSHTTNTALFGRRPLQESMFFTNYSLAITTVVHELLSFGRSRFAAMRIASCGRSPRMIGQ